MQTRSKTYCYIANPDIDPVLEEAFRGSPCERYGHHWTYPNQFKSEMSREVYNQFLCDHKELQQIWVYVRGSRDGPCSTQRIRDAFLAAAANPRWAHLPAARLHTYIAENLTHLLHVSVQIGSLLRVTSRA
jgi:hypothetical protein